MHLEVIIVHVLSVVKVVYSRSVTLHVQKEAIDSVPMVPFNTRLVHIHMSVVKVVSSGSVTLHTQIVAIDSVPTVPFNTRLVHIHVCCEGCVLRVCHFAHADRGMRLSTNGSFQHKTCAHTYVCCEGCVLRVCHFAHADRGMRLCSHQVPKGPCCRDRPDGGLSRWGALTVLECFGSQP